MSTLSQLPALSDLNSPIADLNLENDQILFGYFAISGQPFADSLAHSPAQSLANSSRHLFILINDDLNVPFPE